MPFLLQAASEALQVVGQHLAAEGKGTGVLPEQAADAPYQYGREADPEGGGDAQGGEAPGGIPGQQHEGGHQPDQADDDDDDGRQTKAGQLGQPAGFVAQLQGQQTAAVVQTGNEIGGRVLHAPDVGLEQSSEHGQWTGAVEGDSAGTVSP